MFDAPEGPDVETLLERLCHIPRRASDYLHDASMAAQQFGLDAGTLAALAGAGLSHRHNGGERLYARCDLHYVGLNLGLARQYLWAVGLWRRSLERFTSTPQTGVQISYLPQLADETAELPGRILLPDGRSNEVALRHNEVAGEATVTMHAAWPDMPDDVAAVLEDVASLDFCLLPLHVRGDMALVRALGLTDCFTAACIVVDGCRRLGYEARIVHGLMVVLPFSNVHTWAEVHHAGRWTPVDPIIIAVMHRHAGLDPAAWPCHRSLGPLLAGLRVTQVPVPLVAHRDEPILATYLTRIVSSSS